MTATDDPLVSTDWLAAHIDDPKVKVVDASFKMPGILPLPKDDYLAAHIPGAVFFDVDVVSDHGNRLPHMFPNAEQFGRDVDGRGVYSRSGLSPAQLAGRGGPTVQGRIGMVCRRTLPSPSPTANPVGD